MQRASAAACAIAPRHGGQSHRHGGGHSDGVGPLAMSGATRLELGSFVTWSFRARACNRMRPAAGWPWPAHQGRVATATGQVQPYGRLSFCHANVGGEAATFIGRVASTVIASEGRYDAGEVAAGATLALIPATSLGEIGYLENIGGDATVSPPCRARWESSCVGSDADPIAVDLRKAHFARGQCQPAEGTGESLAGQRCSRSACQINSRRSRRCPTRMGH